MNYLPNGHTDTLPVPGLETATVTFRAMATWDDELLLAKQAREIPKDADEAERGYAFRALRTLLMVESWTLTDRAGQPLPLEVQALQRGMPRRVAAWIDQEAERRYEGRTKEAEGPFGSPSPRTSTVTA